MFLRFIKVIDTSSFLWKKKRKQEKIVIFWGGFHRVTLEGSETGLVDVVVILLLLLMPLQKGNKKWSKPKRKR